MHILIVEDDERIISFMKRGLEAETYEVDIASTKSQTLDLTKACTYDVIILDIFLGPDDGLDICQALRRQGVASSILLMTAKGTAEIEKTSKTAGADAYLAKPFSFDELLATIARLGTPGAPRHQRSPTLEQPAGTSQTISDAFTNADQSRPTHMTVSEPDIWKCLSTHITHIRKQP